MDIIEQIKKENNLGATGKYPHGHKIAKSDEGELKSAIVRKNDTIFMVFGKPIEWVTLSRESERALCMKLIELSNEC